MMLADEHHAVTKCYNDGCGTAGASVARADVVRLVEEVVVVGRAPDLAAHAVTQKREEFLTTVPDALDDNRPGGNSHIVLLYER
jgi:hypothetical protein